MYDSYFLIVQFISLDVPYQDMQDDDDDDNDFEIQMIDSGRYYTNFHISKYDFIKSFNRYNTYILLYFNR